MTAAASAMPKTPTTGQIVNQEALYYAASGTGTLALARGFGGTSNPTTIWQSMISDAQDAYGYYRELEEKDDDVAGPLEELKLGILGRPRQVSPADDSPLAEEIAQFVRQQLDAIPNFHVVLDAILDAPGYGVSISELMWDVSEGQVAVTAINDCPQELFAFGPIGYPQTGPMRFMPRGISLDGGELVDENKFIVWSYRPRSRNRRGRPLLRSVFWPSWFKRNALRFWLRFAEKGPGTAAVKFPQGANEDEQQKALALAEAIVEKIAIAVPENAGIISELLTSARAQNPAVYEHLCDKMAMKITRRILGQTLTSFGSEGGAGSLALGQVHADVKHAREIEMATALQSVINDQLVKRLVLWNYGPSAPAPKWTITTEDEEDLMNRSAIDQRLQQMGAPITRSYVLNKYKLPEPQADDEILAPSRAAAPAAPVDPLLNDPAFSEGKSVKKYLSDVDRLLDQMRGESIDLYRARVNDLLNAVMRSRG